ncbi:MAG: hypothetical protein J6S60_10210 [Oscillospiraceae bacterium]|nr:hypothetical protein [Oscillospiraceae bacterium]
MGIVKTITSGTAVVHIDDGCFGGLDRAEIACRRAEVDRAIWRINQASATSSDPAKAGPPSPEGEGC